MLIPFELPNIGLEKMGLDLIFQQNFEAGKSASIAFGTSKFVIARRLHHSTGKPTEPWLHEENEAHPPTHHHMLGGKVGASVPNVVSSPYA